MRKEFEIERRGNPRDFITKQYQEVRQGYHLVTRIFPPKEYPNATICTPEFKVSVVPEIWKDLRVELLDCFMQNKAIDVEVRGRNYTFNYPSEYFSCEWSKDKHGACIVYDPDIVLYSPLVAGAATITDLTEELPF